MTVLWKGCNAMKTCIACGIYCARPDGTMQNYAEKLEKTVEFLMRTQGFDPEAARGVAVRTLAKLPAWKANAEQQQ